jgi:hypothetical protein
MYEICSGPNGAGNDAELCKMQPVPPGQDASKVQYCNLALLNLSYFLFLKGMQNQIFCWQHVLCILYSIWLTNKLCGVYVIFTFTIMLLFTNSQVYLRKLVLDHWKQGVFRPTRTDIPMISFSRGRVYSNVQKVKTQLLRQRFFLYSAGHTLSHIHIYDSLYSVECILRRLNCRSQAAQ